MRGEDADAERLYRTAIYLDPEAQSGYTFYANFLAANDEPERAARVRMRSIGEDRLC
jgi:Flp pilus assembly protein TadD